MKVFWTAYYELIKNIRDIKVLVALIIFPISIIVLLGTAFDGKLSEDFKEKVQTGYIILDSGDVGRGIEQLLENPETSKYITSSKFETEAEAIKQLNKGKLENYIVVHENTTNKLQKGEAVSINLEGKKNVELIQTILEAYISKSKAYSIALATAGNQNIVLPEEKTNEYFERIAPLSKKLPKAIDYYSVLTLLQVMTMGALLGIFIVARNPQSNINIRLYSLPTSKWEILLGKILGNSIALFLSCVITVVFTKFVYNANWDGNLFIIGATLIVYSFLCIGGGVLIHSLVKSFMSAFGIAFLLMFVLASCGGAISPVAAVTALNIINPLYYAKLLLFGTLYNYPDNVILKGALGLSAMTALMYVISFIKLRRVNYDNI